MMYVPISFQMKVISLVLSSRRNGRVLLVRLLNNLDLTCTMCHSGNVTQHMQHEIKQWQQAQKSEGKMNFSISFIFFLRAHVARAMFVWGDE